MLSCALLPGRNRSRFGLRRQRPAAPEETSFQRVGQRHGQTSRENPSLDETVIKHLDDELDILTPAFARSAQV